jgi:nucleoside 2-deoxyribosyltransferase
MKKIYLAGPYSHWNPAVRAIRFHKLNEKAAELLNAGFLVFSPISHSHPRSGR